jgi:hypothetical protein
VLPRSKTDQTGEGIVNAIPYSDGSCCTAKAPRAWSARKLGAAASAGLSAGSVNTALEDCATLAQLDCKVLIAVESETYGRF